MRLLKWFPALLLATAVVMPWSQGQRRERERRIQGISDRGRTSSRATLPTAPRVRPSRGSTGSRPSGYGGRGRDNAGRFYRNELDQRYLMCRRALSAYSRHVVRGYRPGGLDECAHFFSRLWFRQGIAPSPYLWRYAQGDSPLTPELLRVALRDSLNSAHSAVRISKDLEGLLSEYESGQLTHKEFEDLVDKKTSELRDLADRIRDDQNLAYVDQRQRVKFKSPKAVKTIPELRALITQLQEMAQQMKQGISDFYEKDMTRAVRVEELQGPSLRSISEAVIRLAKVVEKSADRL